MKITYNESVNGWNLEMILTHDSLCVSHFVVQVLRVLFILGVLGSKVLVLVQPWLAWWSYIWIFPTVKAKLCLVLVVFVNVKLNVQGKVQACDFYNLGIVNEWQCDEVNVEGLFVPHS